MKKTSTGGCINNKVPYDFDFIYFNIGLGKYRKSTKGRVDEIRSTLKQPFDHCQSKLVRLRSA